MKRYQSYPKASSLYSPNKLVAIVLTFYALLDVNDVVLFQNKQISRYNFSFANRKINGPRKINPRGVEACGIEPQMLARRQLLYDYFKIGICNHISW